MSRLRVLDPTAYTADDLTGTLAALGPWWAQLVDGRDEADALVTTHLDDTAQLVAALGRQLGLALEPPPDDGEFGALIAWLESAGLAVGRAARAAGIDERTAVAEAVVTAVDNLLDAGDRLRAAGVFPGTVTGTVVGLHPGDGGVPKYPEDVVGVAPDGVVGDRQATRRHHGRPWQALSVWSEEVIHAFAAQGHRLAPGRAGENVTVRGLPWDEVRSGVRLALGEVLVEVSVFAPPCQKNAHWFTDGRFDRMHHDRGPVSRVYASVLVPGTIRVGDPAVLEPDALTSFGPGTGRTRA